MLEMASNKNQNFKMIGLRLRFQLLVVFYLINGRYAYKEYLSDDAANEYNHETGTNFSQINYNEPPDLFDCCRISFGSCRSSCENLSLVQLSMTSQNGKDMNLSELRRNCPSVQTDFWQCMNHTLHAVYRGAHWSGRLCCSHAITVNCQNTCATSMSSQETLSSCRRSDEQTLFDCFERQENGDNCCGSARTSECLEACRDIFQSEKTATKEQRQFVEHACNDNNTNLKVLNCVREIMDVTPIENPRQYLPCCGHSRSAICRETCKNILEIGETMQEIIDTLSKGGCGPPLPHQPLWQCFLSGNHHPMQTADGAITSQISQIGIDSAKLHCCHKALSPKCRRLCYQTFSNGWTETRDEFDNDCYAELNEISLRQCLDEVDEPCELGCDGLSFCTNFNNRPTELFRSCNLNADSAARAVAEIWKDTQSLSLPGLNLPIKDIDKCEPEAWQAITCILQVKPCSRSKHTTQICREDCYDLLANCIDWTRMETRHTPDSICSRFSADSENSSSPCISLKPYLEPNDVPQNGWPSANQQIISPCRDHTCNASEVCVPNNKRDHHGVEPTAMGFRCVPGCPLGETSMFLVPIGSYARIPISMKQKGCFKLCRCMPNGRLDECQPLPCMSYDSCKLGDRQIEHGSWFHIECNICSCFAGDITCTKKQCRMPGISEHFTSLPCNCAPHHVPVCGNNNGYTYPSECVSKCAGLQVADIEYRSCRDNNPCRDAKCPNYAQCIENRQICLTVMHRPCRQYQCINTTANCRIGDKPVCSTDNKTFASLCHLVKAKATLAYSGRCIDSCRKTPVCGVNGISYKSECEAWSDYSIADYDGECREIGLFTNTLGPRCASVKCNYNTKCKQNAIIPPGACCPICGGAVRIIYSRKQIDRALFTLKGKNTDILTLKGVLRALDNLIQVAHCRLSGYLTIENDIFVIVNSHEMNLSELQHEACFREAEKIATLIDTQSHKITSNIVLSALTVANVVRAEDLDLQVSAGSLHHYSQFIVLIVIAISIVCNRVALM